MPDASRLFASLLAALALSGGWIRAQAPTTQLTDTKTGFTWTVETGFTWTVEGTITNHGVFLLGERWFVPDPAYPNPRVLSCQIPTQGSPIQSQSRPVSGSVALRHGSMKNPRGGLLVPATGQYRKLGYDSRIDTYDYQRVFDFTADTLSPGDVLVTVESNPDQTQSGCIPGTYCHLTIYCTLFGDNRGGSSVIRQAAVLTCLAAAPLANSFRPPYAMDPARRVQGNPNALPNFTSQQIQWNSLPGLQAPTAVVQPDLAKMIRMFERVWLGDYYEESVEDKVNPTEHMPGYGEQTANMVSTAALLLCEHPLRSQASLEPLMHGFLQVGLDTYGLVSDGHRFIGGGGKNAGHKTPMVIAGHLLGYPALSVTPTFNHNPLGQQTHDYTFKEDVQAYFKTDSSGATLPDWQGNPWRWCSTYPFGHRDYQGEHPLNWGTVATIQLGDIINDEAYRYCCSIYPWIGQNLAIRALGLMSAWGNDSWFWVSDRFMIPESNATCDAYEAQPSFVSHRTAGHGYMAGPYSEYTRGMWRMHRWSRNPPGVLGVLPATFLGTEFDCRDAAFSNEVWPCHDPTPPFPAPPEPRRRHRFPVLLTNNSPLVPAPMRFEVYDIPMEVPSGSYPILAWVVLGWQGQQWHLDPGAGCCPVGNQFCQAPVFIGASSIVGFQQVTNSYGYAAAQLGVVLPPGPEIIVQALVFDANGRVYTTNALRVDP